MLAAGWSRGWQGGGYGDASTESMGDTAENVAERFGVSGEDQDAFALESHRRAVAAAETGRFDPEIVAIDVPQPKARR